MMNISTFSKRFFLIFCINLFFNVYAQNYTEKQIDSLQNDAILSLRDKGEYQKFILLNQQTIKESEKIYYDRGITRGYIRIANALFLLSNNRESLRFLTLAEKNDCLKNDNILLAELYVEYSRNYEVLGFYEKANQYLDKAIYYGRKIKATPNYGLNYAYSYKATNSVVAKFPDSVLYYLHKGYAINPNPIDAGKISFWYISNKKLDSAEYYIKNAWDKASRQPDLKYQKGSVLWGMGNFYYAKKQYDKALECYQQSLEVYDQIRRKEDVCALYKIISNAYDSLKQPDKATEYLARYTVLNDSLSQKQKQVLDVSVTHFLEEQEQQNQSSKEKLYYIISMMSVTALILGSIGFIFYKRKKKEGKIKISDLEQKVNVAYDEVVQLAKNNDPAFFGKFREVYPEFCDKLLKINPGLVNSELKFCALLFLNFSTKEIATYTFVQPGAVRIRKNRIRKKLDIPSDQDINVWMSGLNQ